MVPIDIDFAQCDTPKPLLNTSNKNIRSRDTKKKLATAKDLSSFFLIDLQMKELSALAAKELKTFRRNIPTAEDLSSYFLSKLERKESRTYEYHSSENAALEKAKDVSESRTLKSVVSRKRSLAETQNSSLSYSRQPLSYFNMNQLRNKKVKFIDPSFHSVKEAKMTDTGSTHVQNEYQQDTYAKLSDGQPVSELISDSHRELITPFEYSVLCQVAISSFEEADMKGNRSCVPPKFTGLACSHCNGRCRSKTGRYFPTALKTISDPKKMLLPLYRHLKSCEQCPIDTKEKLALEFENYRNAKSHLPHGSRTSFYRLLWARMHPDSALVKKKRGRGQKLLEHVSL